MKDFREYRNMRASDFEDDDLQKEFDTMETLVPFQEAKKMRDDPE